MLEKVSLLPKEMVESKQLDKSIKIEATPTSIKVETESTPSDIIVFGIVGVVIVAVAYFKYRRR